MSNKLFSINEFALAEIQRSIHRKKYHDPVISLCNRAVVKHLFNNVHTAFLEGEKTEEELAVMAPCVRIVFRHDKHVTLISVDILAECVSLFRPTRPYLQINLNRFIP